MGEICPRCGSRDTHPNDWCPGGEDYEHPCGLTCNACGYEVYGREEDDDD